MIAVGHVPFASLPIENQPTSSSSKFMEERMTKAWIALAVCALWMVETGCASQQQQLAARQPAAEQTALQRGRFDLNCPTATATVLSSDYIQPAIQGPWVNGLTRVEYTIGVAGCNQRTTYVVICQEGTDTCFAANPRGQQ